MQRFRRMRCLQKFTAVHSSVYNHYNHYNHYNKERSLTSRGTFRLTRSAALAEWRELGAAFRTAPLA